MRFLKCKCGARFANDGVFLTCESCRRAFTEEEKRQQGCHHWGDLPDRDRRVTRVERTNESF